MLRTLLFLALLNDAIPADEPPHAARRVSLPIRVVPAVDPSGRPWKVQLLERRDGKDEIVADEPAPANRGLELEAIEKRLYSLRLRTADGDVWFTDTEPFEAKSAMPVRLVEPKALTVRGLVTLGKRPLAKAHLTFGSEGGPESVSLTSKEDGTLAGFLPRFGRWHVTSRSETPHLHLEVDVDVIHSDRGAELDVEVRLIPTGIEGELVDVNGDRVMKARVYLSGPQGEHRDEPFEGGTFRYDFLTMGVNDVYASSAYRDDDLKTHVLFSELHDVAVEGRTADPAWLRLVLLKEISFRGRVVSPGGEAVSGARLLVVGGRAGAGGAPMPSPRSGRDGRFSLRVLEGTSEACILTTHDSYSARLTRLQVTGDEQELPVSPPGGTLLIDAPFWNSKRLDDKKVIVFHSGCAIYPRLFQIFVKGSHGDTGVRWTDRMPRVEPGPYSVCALTDRELAAYDGRVATFDPCVAGVLVPGGTLELKLLP